MNGKKDQVSYRLAPEYAQELDRRAAKAQVSRHEYARQVLITELSRDPESERINNLGVVLDEVQMMRQELFTSVAALLSSAGKVSVEEASSWVRDTLMK